MTVWSPGAWERCQQTYPVASERVMAARCPRPTCASNTADRAVCTAPSGRKQWPHPDRKRAAGAVDAQGNWLTDTQIAAREASRA